MKKAVLFVILVAALSFLGAGCKGNVVATVDGKAITAAQLEEEVNQTKKMMEQQGMLQGGMNAETLAFLRQQVLEQMINEELLLREASRLGVEPTDKQVEEEIKNFRQQFQSEAEYRKFLAANGFSEPKLKDYVRKNLAVAEVQKEASKNAKEVSDEQAKDFYEKNKDLFGTPEKFQIRQVLVPVTGDDQKALVDAKATAMNILNGIKQGGDFPSPGENSPEENGPTSAVYVFSSGEAEPEIEKAVQSLKPGQLFPEPVRTKYGFHVFRLEQVIPAQTTPFEEAKVQIVAYLSQQAQDEAFNQYLDNLRAKANIVNNLAKK